MYEAILSILDNISPGITPHTVQIKNAHQKSIKQFLTYKHKLRKKRDVIQQLIHECGGELYKSQCNCTIIFAQLNEPNNMIKMYACRFDHYMIVDVISHIISYISRNIYSDAIITFAAVYNLKIDNYLFYANNAYLTKINSSLIHNVMKLITSSEFLPIFSLEYDVDVNINYKLSGPFLTVKLL